MLHPIRPRPIDTLCRVLAAIAVLGTMGVLGCTPSPEVEQTVRDVDISAFSAPPMGPLPAVVSTPLPQVEPPGVTEIEHTVTLADGTKVIRKEEVVTAADPATAEDDSLFIDQGNQRTLRVGQRWLVESLIGDRKSVV